MSTVVIFNIFIQCDHRRSIPIYLFSVATVVLFPHFYSVWPPSFSSHIFIPCCHCRSFAISSFTVATIVYFQYLYSLCPPLFSSHILFSVLAIVLFPYFYSVWPSFSSPDFRLVWPSSFSSHIEKKIISQCGKKTMGHLQWKGVMYGCCCPYMVATSCVNHSLWRHQMETFDVSFHLRLNKRLSKQSRLRWFETSSRSLWRHCNE